MINNLINTALSDSLFIKIMKYDHKIIEQLENGYYENINGIPHRNAGLEQALRRIEAIYRNKHTLGTHSENGFFSMELILEPETIPPDPTNKTGKKLAYESA